MQMNVEGYIKTLFSDKDKTEALFPRTKVKAVSDDNGVELNVILGELNTTVSDLQTQMDGKAPAGYGVGEYASTYTALENANTATATGLYRITSATENGIGVSGTLWVEGYGGTYCAQYAVGSSKGTFHKRVQLNGNWSEWEWIDPPMEEGVEYRTTERYSGKAVYTKLINFGALPNNSNKSVCIGGKYSIISIDAIMTNGTNYFAFPHVYGDGMRARIAVAGTNVVIYTTVDMSAYSAMVKLKYTKD